MPGFTMTATPKVLAEFDQIAAEQGVTFEKLLERALTLRAVAHWGLKAGQHIGFVDDPAMLDTEIVGFEAAKVVP